MISLVRSIGHTGHYLSYMTGESERKKNPEKVYHVCDNLLPPQLDAHAILESFKYACRGHSRMKNFGIEMVYSPSPEHTKDFNMEDWERLTSEYIHELDSIEIRDPEKNELYSEKTHFERSKYAAYLHFDSKSSVPHVHIGMCRVDDDGNTNNDHMIHLRAQWAAERVAIRHGWTTAQEIHVQHVQQMSKVCEEILKKMDSYSFEGYCAALTAKGYKVAIKSGNTGYAIVDGYTKYKGSDLEGRHFTIPNLPKTWAKLHQEEAKKKEKPQVKKPIPANPKQPAFQPKSQPTSQMQSPKQQSQQPTKSSNRPLGGYLEPRSGCSLFRFTHEGVKYRRYLPDWFTRKVNDEYDYRFFEDVDVHIGLASAIFAGIYAGLMAQTQTSGGGGGGQSTSGWGRKRDEDEERWANRAIALANGIRPKKSKSRSKGY